jgi:hypothetical protein
MAGTHKTLNDGFFAKLLFDCMFSAEFAQSIREEGFDVIKIFITNYSYGCLTDLTPCFTGT